MIQHRLLSTLFCAFVAWFATAQPRAKYVFYFIGDGMGVNQVNAAETFLAAREGRIGMTPLCFTQFPYLGLVSTYSASSGITDSAASGTALASGVKTKNAAVGVLPDLTTPVNSVAWHAQQHGAAVGISTSVGVNHATPAVFYAHVPERHAYHEIGRQLTTSGFDFFAGSDILEHRSVNGDKDLYDQAADNGYKIVRGYEDFLHQADRQKKLILLQPLADSEQNDYAIPYKLDRKPANLSLEQITRAGIRFLSERQKEHSGFFLMVEGGMIDMACHSNDGAGFIHELLDMDSCVQIAYEFYQRHPDSTLIVVTADHETGGLSLGRGKYELHLDKLIHQKTSFFAYPRHLAALRREKGRDFSWEVVREDLKQHFGFWDKIVLTDEQTERLHQAYRQLVEASDKNKASGKNKKSLYNSEDAISYTASQIMDEHSLIGWQSNGHSNGFVGVYAIGAGAEQFTGQMDNTDIPRKIMRAAGWE